MILTNIEINEYIKKEFLDRLWINLKQIFHPYIILFIHIHPYIYISSIYIHIYTNREHQMCDTIEFRVLYMCYIYVWFNGRLEAV